jgi:hypothetical protein
VGLHEDVLGINNKIWQLGFGKYSHTKMKDVQNVTINNLCLTK